MMQVELEVDLGHGIIVAPAGLLGYEKSEFVVDDLGTTLFVDVSELQVHLRLHDHFMGKQSLTLSVCLLKRKSRNVVKC
jgi:hypothetical protein